MSIATALTALSADVENARQAIANMGGTVTPNGGTGQLSADIATIPQGSSVTIEPLSVAENGTYTADEGKAYSPVTVNVPTDKRVLYFTPSSNVSVVTLTHNLGAVPTHATALATDPSPDGSAKFIVGTTQATGDAGRLYGYRPDGTTFTNNTGFRIGDATATSVTFIVLSAYPFRANVEYCFVISA